jgi:hypothetical protein
VTITVDTRERYPYRFGQQAAETVRATVAAGDYAILWVPETPLPLSRPAVVAVGGGSLSL